ncbi:pyridoxamine 5'-phosphate oxidase family protein [Chitinophaga sp. MM2321]|uniref:pyridoxamine 5'-phosphate oxidase family protein n=1 Tax=Chitinophaga sp. MM2321 TaxID=3137178 RepID=UPI0032D570B9
MLGKLSLDEIDQVLTNNHTGRIGCTDGEKVYIVPVSYAFNKTYLVAHSKEGMKIDMMRKRPQICFQVDEIADMANWRSVVVWGNYEEVIDPKERYYAMKFLVSRLSHMPASETAGVAEMHREMEEPVVYNNIIRPVVYRIRITEKTGRFEKN